MLEFFITIIGIVGVLFLAFIYGIFSWAFVVMYFWLWFVMPLFPTLPVINFYQAMGLWFFISLFHNQTMPAIKEEYLKKTEGIVAIIIATWITLFLGYCAHTWFIH
jgi:hypothetical protein